MDKEDMEIAGYQFNDDHLNDGQCKNIIEATEMAYRYLKGRGLLFKLAADRLKLDIETFKHKQGTLKLIDKLNSQNKL